MKTKTNHSIRSGDAKTVNAVLTPLQEGGML